MFRTRMLILATLALAGCDQLGLNDGKNSEAEGKAIGAACRHAGRALEDCYQMNPAASKAAVFAGWKEMNDYMTEQKLEVVKPTLPPPMPKSAKSKKKTTDEVVEEEEEPASSTPKADKSKPGAEGSKKPAKEGATETPKEGASPPQEGPKGKRPPAQDSQKGAKIQG